MRVLVTGAAGLLGGRLAEALSTTCEVWAGVRRAAAPAGLRALPLDLDDPRSLAAALEATEPDAIVHSAALSEPDRCEREPELAWHANVTVAERLARACRERGLGLLALSTDMVFDGREGGRAEDDPAEPLQVYGRTKLAAERALLEAHPAAAVVRVCLVYGRGHGPRGSASEAVAWALRASRRARLFTDQRRTPVDPRSLGELVERALRLRASGVFHGPGPEAVTRHGLGLRVASTLGLDAGLIDAANSADAPQPAQRPVDVTLKYERARRELGWSPRPMDEAIREGRDAPDAEP